VPFVEVEHGVADHRRAVVGAGSGAEDVGRAYRSEARIAREVVEEGDGRAIDALVVGGCDGNDVARLETLHRSARQQRRHVRGRPEDAHHNRGEARGCDDFAEPV
jgi:hypothetical protein